MQHLLFVDTGDIAEIINACRALGDKIDTVEDIDEALDLLKLANYSGVIGCVNGDDPNCNAALALAVRVRRAKHKLPILIVTPMCLPSSEEVQLLEAGVDDVLRRPINIEVFHARIDAIERRLFHRADGLIELSGFSADVIAQRLCYGNTNIPLTTKEFRVLNLLLDNRGKIVTRAHMMHYLYGWGTKNEPDLKILDVFICKLRNKLRAAAGSVPWLTTVWGRGWMIPREPAEIVTGPDLKILEHSDLSASA